MAHVFFPACHAKAPGDSGSSLWTVGAKQIEANRSWQKLATDFENTNNSDFNGTTFVAIV